MGTSSLINKPTTSFGNLEDYPYLLDLHFSHRFNKEEDKIEGYYDFSEMYISLNGKR